MSVRETAKKQHVQNVNRTTEILRNIYHPQMGWLALIRNALGMSAAQVAARMEVSRNAIYQAERNELKGAITIAQMQKIAEAMGAEFVYAVVPKDSVEDLIHTQAQRKAKALIRRASSHMALEDQSLSKKQIEKRIELLTDELIQEMPSDFWELE